MKGLLEVVMILLNCAGVVFSERYSIMALPVMPLPPVTKATFGLVMIKNSCCLVQKTSGCRDLIYWW